MLVYAVIHEEEKYKRPRQASQVDRSSKLIIRRLEFVLGVWFNGLAPETYYYRYEA